MKKANLLLAITFLAIMVGCERKTTAIDLITVDVTKSYPEKRIVLQDFMDVDYVALETTDEFVTQGVVVDIGKKIILVTNRNRDGNIFVYDRSGKGLRKINRMGRGPEEYSPAYNIVMDEESDEIFVHDISLRKILVYDLNGKFKRSFIYNNDDEALRYSVVYNYDRNQLICYDATGDLYEERQCNHVIISKQDGSVIRKILLPFEKKKSTLARIQDGEMIITTFVPFRSILPYQGQWILTQPSCDTIYKFLSNGSMIPFIVRTPSIQSITPEVFLSPELITDRYYFMVASEKVGKINNGNVLPFPQTYLMYDRKEKEMYKYTVFNGDFLNEKKVSLNSGPINDELVACRTLGADQLIDSFKKNELKEGKLKDLVAKLEEEDNPVIMLIKYKQ